MDQISLYDYKPKKFNTPMYPEYPDCNRTCKHFLPLDCYPGTRIPRCNYKWREDGPGDGLIEAINDNRVHFWCKYYEEDEHDKQREVR